MLNTAKQKQPDNYTQPMLELSSKDFSMGA